MRTEILMPKLGLTMTQGTVMEWMKKVGDPVSKGEILFTVENDKAVVEVESPAEGVLEEILVSAGSSQEVGKPVAYLTTSLTKASTTKASTMEDGKDTEAAKRSPPPEEKKKPIQSQEEVILRKGDRFQPPALKPAEASEAYIPASPIAKRLAFEKRIDLSTLHGTGPGGAVVERDLSPYPSSKGVPLAQTQEMAASAVSISQPDQAQPKTSKLHTLSPFQARAAERMVQSWSTIPQFTLWMDVEVDSFLSFHQNLKDRGSPVSFTVLLSKFLALTLQQYPLLNASWRGQGTVEVFPEVHVGIATDTPTGLFVPVLRNCDTKPLKVLQEEWQEISSRVKEGRLSSSDLTGSTITLTNLGMFGVKRFQAIVNPPQVGILSVGEVIRRPKEGASFVSVIEFGLSADHRVVDGAYGARFLKSFKDALESPLFTLASRA